MIVPVGEDSNQGNGTMIIPVGEDTGQGVGRTLHRGFTQESYYLSVCSENPAETKNLKHSKTFVRFDIFLCVLRGKKATGWIGAI